MSRRRGRHSRHGSLTGWAALAVAVAVARQQQADLKRACYTTTPTDLRSAR